MGFNSGYKGTTMFKESNGPLPCLENMDDILGNWRWVLGVFRDIVSNPLQGDFNNARYFVCPKEQRDIQNVEIETWKKSAWPL